MSDLSNGQAGSVDGVGIGAPMAGEAGARGAVDKTLGKVAGVVGRAFGEPVARRVRETAEAALDQAEDVYDAALDAYGATRERLDQRLADEPYKMLAVAAGAGLLLGMMLGRRNHTIIYRPRG